MNKIKYQNGFTLIEMLIVIGLIMFIAAMYLFVDMNTYRGDAFRAEMSIIGVTLQTARAESMNNVNQNKHGVAFYPTGVDGYVLFEGNSYSTRDQTKDEVTNASYKINFPSTPTEIVFEQLSGNALYNNIYFDGDISLLDTERNLSKVISINHEGRISW